MTETDGATQPAGLRERKKEATRRALHEAAVRLAVEHGVEHLTVDAIADAADVSRRTFSNYFASKEEALFWGDEQWLGELATRFVSRPAAESAWVALTATAREVMAERDADPDWSGRVRLMRRDPTLLARRVASIAALERSLAEVVGPRVAPGPEHDEWCRLLAAALLTGLRVATATWIRQPDEPLEQVVARTLDRLGRAWT